MMNKIAMSLLVVLGLSSGCAEAKTVAPSANTLENSTSYLVTGKVTVESPVTKGQIKKIEFRIAAGNSYGFPGIVQGIQAYVVGIPASDEVVIRNAHISDDKKTNKFDVYLESSHGGTGAWVIAGPDNDGKLTIDKK